MADALLTSSTGGAANGRATVSLVLTVVRGAVGAACQRARRHCRQIDRRLAPPHLQLVALAGAGQFGWNIGITNILQDTIQVRCHACFTPPGRRAGAATRPLLPPPPPSSSSSSVRVLASDSV